MENGHLWWIYLLKMVIFHCYVSSPEGIQICPLVPSTWGHDQKHTKQIPQNPKSWFKHVQTHFAVP
jgi:hypothetical protein